MGLGVPRLRETSVATAKLEALHDALAGEGEKQDRRAGLWIPQKYTDFGMQVQRREVSGVYYRWGTFYSGTTRFDRSASRRDFEGRLRAESLRGMDRRISG